MQPGGQLERDRRGWCTRAGTRRARLGRERVGGDAAGAVLRRVPAGAAERRSSAAIDARCGGPRGSRRCPAAGRGSPPRPRRRRRGSPARPRRRPGSARRRRRPPAAPRARRRRPRRTTIDSRSVASGREAARAAPRPARPGRGTGPTASAHGAPRWRACSASASAIGALPGGNRAASSTSPCRSGSDARRMAPTLARTGSVAGWAGTAGQRGPRESAMPYYRRSARCRASGTPSSASRTAASTPRS